MKIIISDSNHTETATDIDSAINIIDGWYNSDGFSEAVQSAAEEATKLSAMPASVDGLQSYADDLCQKIAELTGEKDFYGHGTYKVSAAAQGGFDIKIDIQYDFKHPKTEEIKPYSEWYEIYENSTEEEWGGLDFEDAGLVELK